MVHSFLPFPVLFIFLCRSKFLSQFIFFFCLKNSFKISRSSGLLVINSFSLCVAEKILISLHIWKTFSLGIEFELTVFPHFSTFKMFLQSLLAFIVSDETSAVFILFAPLIIMSFFSSDFLHDFLFPFGLQEFKYVSKSIYFFVWWRAGDLPCLVFSQQKVREPRMDWCPLLVWERSPPLLLRFSFLFFLSILLLGFQLHVC